MDKIKALNYFKRVIELNSFTSVADEFNVPPSSISRRVKDLEKELGIELIQRTTRHVKATELGKLYYQQITPALSVLEEADELISTHKEAIEGKIRLSITTSFGEKVLLPVLQKFRMKHPNITLMLDFSDDVTNFAEENVDIAIRAGHISHERIVAKPISSSEFKLVSTPNLLKNLLTQYQRKTLTSEDLASCPTLQYGSSNAPLPWWEYCEKNWHPITLKPIFTSNSGEALMHATLSGEGLALFPYWWVRPYLRDGSLIEVPTELPISNGKMSNLDIYLVYQQAKYQIPKIKACIDFISQELEL